MAPADEAEVYHRMCKWYHSPERDALRAAWGAYPRSPGALQAWPGFVRVTNAFLDYEAAHGRRGEPVAAEAESELVVWGEVVPEVMEGEEGVVTEPVVASETMEREAPAEGAAEEPRGWFSWLLGPRRESGAAADAEASMPETEQAEGKIEFLGNWHDKPDDRAMPIKFKSELRFYPANLVDSTRIAFGLLVDELVQKKAPSGILAIHHRDWFHQSSYFSWSASPDDESFRRHGFIHARPGGGNNSVRKGHIRFADFAGAIHDKPPRGKDNRIAVYRVTLPSGGLDRGKWAGRPPPPVPAALRTGRRSDGLLSTDDISGEYYNCCTPCPPGPGEFFCCPSKTVVPLGPDMIETWDSSLCFPCVPFPFCGPRVRGKVWKRKGTNAFSRPHHATRKWLKFSADGTVREETERNEFYGAHNNKERHRDPPVIIVHRKCSNSRKLAFQKVDARDLAGYWYGCCGAPMVPFCPLSHFFCTTKKALDEDRYEESGVCCFLGLPCPVESTTRTRSYVNGLPTNGFALDSSPNDIHWHRDSGCSGYRWHRDLRYGCCCCDSFWKCCCGRSCCEELDQMLLYEGEDLSGCAKKLY